MNSTITWLYMKIEVKEFYYTCRKYKLAKKTKNMASF